MAVKKVNHKERIQVKPRRRIPFSLKPMIEEGEFEAKITNAEIADSVDFGNDKIPRLAVDFLLKDGRRLKQNLLLIESTNNPAYQLIMTVFGCLEDAYVDGLIGKEVGIEVIHKDTNAGTFANVKRVFSINDDCEEDAEVEELSSELHEEEVTEEAPYDSDGEDEMDI
ncbi:hypothetical protein [Clostridium neonatale]|uniref:hypothetical protein n=1 Tax=Clostridium neonatale TaxID=137838 RepID=UPI00291C127F|nr:conserved hypothetical protein [Clostridium neonatale]CAI3628129.1 conserved hypothetical protein [Clostridium neonatale]CAI3673441.1 conserved hypothetical protein [Clostridium neonatale]CAI3688267.1 conserved hypothetical protein [Clostridium neonatale]CAI3699631.1 conserved hypothetical protein [Clostridium neonatale]